MTIVMVTHSPDCAGYARRIMRVTDGKLGDDNVKLRSLKRWQKKEKNKEPFPNQSRAIVVGSLPTG